jgi:hypothetical protein
MNNVVKLIQNLKEMHLGFLRDKFHSHPTTRAQTPCAHHLSSQASYLGTLQIRIIVKNVDDDVVETSRAHKNLQCQFLPFEV